MFEGAQGSCWISTTAPIPSSPVQHHRRRRRHRLRLPVHCISTTCWVSPRPTPPASARGRFPRSCLTTPASTWPPAGTSSGATTGRPAAAAGSTPSPCAVCRQYQLDQRYLPDQARCTGRTGDHPHLCRLYRQKGQPVPNPIDAEDYAKLLPVYEEVPGWSESTLGQNPGATTRCRASLHQQAGELVGPHRYHLNGSGQGRDDSAAAPVCCRI